MKEKEYRLTIRWRDDKPLPEDFTDKLKRMSGEIPNSTLKFEVWEPAFKGDLCDLGFWANLYEEEKEHEGL